MPKRAKWMIAALTVTTFIIFLSLTGIVAQYERLQNQVDDLARDFIHFDPNPMPVSNVSRETITIESGATCFTDMVAEAVTIGLETWSFDGTVIPENFDGVYRASEITTAYGGELGLKLGRDNCFDFSGFPQPMPARLIKHLAENPQVSPLMRLRILVRATDMTDPVNPIDSPSVIVHTMPFRIPPNVELDS